MILLSLSVLLSIFPTITTNKTNTSSSIALLPIIDSCNHHGSDFNAEVSLLPVNGNFLVKTTRDIQENEEV